MSATVWVVDDEAPIRSLLTTVLEKASYSVVELADAAALKDRFGGPAPDVILLDLNLPGVGGMELCHRMKGDPRLAHIPVVILTGAYKEVRDRVRGLERGADDYILKPFDLDILLARLNSICRVKGKVA